MQNSTNYNFTNNLFNCTYKNLISENTQIYETHCHNYFEIILVLNGNINIVIENNHYTINTQSAILIPPLKYHSIYTSESTNYERIIILFSYNSIPVEIRESIRSLNDAILIQNNSETTLLNEKLKIIISKSDNQFYAPLITSYITEFFYEFLSNKNSTLNKNISNIDKTINLILEYIESHINEKISLDEISTALYFSKSTICHLFKEKFKISIKQYILQKKIALAEDMISKGETAINAAVAVGYTNYANFFSAYKKITKKCPSNIKQTALYLQKENGE